jgi:hypothetical protein
MLAYLFLSGAHLSPYVDFFALFARALLLDLFFLTCLSVWCACGVVCFREARATRRYRYRRYGRR